jgi:D-alanyl-D-alanine carboxypeptidase/D-alanyl-D-alanine-endopeptidase (penicillin-binding protein 4)
MIKLSLLFLLNLSFGSEKLEGMIRNSSVASGASIVITKVNGDTVLNWNAKTARTPASLTKLAIAGGVYKYLDLDTKWQSEFLIKETNPRTEVENLCFSAGGDPAFVSESMWVLVNNLYRSGIRKIQKDIIVDESLFDAEIFDKGRGDTRVTRAYDAPVSAASFNWNAVNIYVKPSTVGNLVTITMDPENEYFQIINDVKTVRGSVNQLKQGLSFDRLEVGTTGEKIRLKGSLGVDNQEVVVYRSVSQPALWLGYNIKSFLKQRGITVDGKVKVGSCKSYSNVVASHKSKDLQLIIRDMMKYSNNFVTEMLVKHISLTTSKVGNMSDGKKIIQKYLASIGVDDFTLESVSGLSYDNSVSVGSINKILLDLNSNFHRFEALETLPLAGIDGTLKGRMGKSVNVRAKTGLLSTVVGLAGYAEDKNRQLYSFVMVYNGKDTYKAKDVFDKILIELVR